MFYAYNYNIRVTHEMVLSNTSHTTNQIHGGRSSADCSLLILSLHVLALHLAVKILLQIFLYEDLSTLALHTSIGFISSRYGQHDRTLLHKPILLVKTFLIFDINHQQNTRRSDQIETIKTIMQTTRPRITWKVYQWLRLPFFKEIFDQVRKI